MFASKVGPLTRRHVIVGAATASVVTIDANAQPATRPAGDVPEATARKPSDEVDQKQLDMARREGDAFHQSLRYMAGEKADGGGLQRVGDYIVAFAQERAEGMWMAHGEGKLVWMEAKDENCHIEVVVSDAVDRRFLPGLDVEVSFLPERGKPIGPMKVPFVWHPGLYHYGRNLKLPGDGRYTIRIRIAAPKFMRHDKDLGRLYASTVTAEFKDVVIKTGRE